MAKKPFPFKFSQHSSIVEHSHEISSSSARASPKVNVTENEKYILFRSTNHVPSIEDIQLESLANVNEAFLIFLKRHTCYDLVPASSKLVAFDTELSVKKAFFALVYNGVRAAPVWDARKQCFIGVLTITDFIKILVKFYRSPSHPMEELENHKISTWRELLEEYNRPLTYITPDATLLDAVNLLINHKVHRLPIIDQSTGNALHILTHKRILKYLHLNMHLLPSPEFLSQTLTELKIGTFASVISVHKNATVMHALKMFLENRVSALPVLDDENRLVDIYAKFDVINLAATRTYDNLDITVYEALGYRRGRFDGVAVCSKDDTFRFVLDTIVEAGVHRLVVVDDSRRVIGIVSLSDILEYFISPK